MIKILIVDDDYEKVKLIIRNLREIEGIEEENFLEARDVLNAKRILTKEKIDLLLLDINIPLISGDDPIPNGGLNLLEQLSLDETLNKPRSIIGVTGYDHIYDESKPVFDNIQWTLVKFERSSSEWVDRIRTKLTYLMNPNDVFENFFDIVIITALHSTELEAVLRLPCEWQEFRVSNDPTIYYRGIIDTGSHQFNVVAAAALRMGMSATASLSVKMSMLFRPKYIFMVGIAAGIEGKCKYGDILVADPSWDWGNGKLTLVDGVPTFLPAPHQIGIDSKFRALLKHISVQREFLDDIQNKWHEKVHHSLQLLVGPVASGASVLEDPNISANIRNQHRELIGVEMEIYGLMAAVEYIADPKPISLAFKSVCDFADIHKNDQWQTYAAYTSANFMYQFICKYID